MADVPYRHRNLLYNRNSQGSLMTMNDSSSDHPRTPAAKKPYEKPAFRSEKIFVTSALSCGKIDPTSGSCIGHSKVS
jgi:hypothetical protein